MTQSKAFQGIRSDVIKIANAIPPGKVTTFGAIGEYMTVMPRHVAYVLSQLQPHEQDEVAWYRVVGASGSLGKNKADARGQRQSDWLGQEGVGTGDGKVLDFPDHFVAVETLSCGVEPGKNYSK